MIPRLLRRCLVVLAVIYASAGRAYADNIGVAAYGLMSPHWDCDGFMHAFDGEDTLRFSFLYNTFGDDRRCLDRALADKRPKAVEMILINESCPRFGRCGNYEILAGLSPGAYANKLKSRDPAFLARLQDYFAAAFDLIKGRVDRCYVSPGLESNLKDDGAISVLLVETRKAFPGCRVVWNPVKMGPRRSDADLMEGHTVESPYMDAPCIASLDGQDMHDVPDIAAYTARYAACDLNFLWTVSMNGSKGQGPFLDPRLRAEFAVPPEVGAVVQGKAAPAASPAR